MFFQNIKLERLLSLPLFLLFINNTNTGITHNYGYLYYLGYSLPFLGISLYLFFTKINIPNNTLAHLCLVISIISIIDNDISNYSGAFFFMSSVSISLKNKYNYFVYGIVFISALIFKFNSLGALPSQILGYFSGVSFYAIIHFKKIHKSKESFRLDIYNQEIDPMILDCVEEYLTGKPWAEIARPHNITGKYLRSEVTKVYKDMGFSNLPQFTYYIGTMPKKENLEKK